MERYIVKGQKKLRVGYTTGSAAAGAAKAAAVMLLMGGVLKEVGITIPSGEGLTLAVTDATVTPELSSCAVVKDGGDDPDCTTGMKIFARVVKTEGGGVLVEGGEGIGRVTRPGLQCPVGSAAINPVPRSMIERSVSEAMAQCGYVGGVKVTIFAPEGEAAAKNTFNPRLGIVGGISILGTTGLVEPMSDSALIDTIKLEISAQDNGRALVLSPGNYGLNFLKNELGIDCEKAVKCSNFIGEALDFAVYSGIKRILLVGHMGKLVKLAAGVMNTHSSVADCRGEVFASQAGAAGAPPEIIRALLNATTTDDMHNILSGTGLLDEVYMGIMARAVINVGYRVKNLARVELIMFSAASGAIVKSGGAMELVEEIRD